MKNEQFYDFQMVESRLLKYDLRVSVNLLEDRFEIRKNGTIIGTVFSIEELVSFEKGFTAANHSQEPKT